MDGRCYTLTTCIVYYTSVDRNALIPLLRFVVDLLYNVLCRCAAVEEILTDTACRAVRLR